MSETTMPPADTKLLLDNLTRLAALITVEDARALVEEMDREMTLMPFLDPTAFMRIADTAPDHIRVARAFLTFRLELQKVLAQ